FRHPTAILAIDHGGVAAAILKNDDLFISGKGFLDVSHKQSGELTLYRFAFAFLVHVRKDDLGELGISEAFFESHYSVFARDGMVERLYRWRCRTQNDLCVVDIRHHERSVAGVVARSWFLLLIACVVFFIDDDESKVVEWEKNGRTYADDKFQFPVKDSVPHFNPFVV